MVAIGLVGGAIGVSLLAFGGFRLHGFLHAMKLYREKTKSETAAVPSSFLKLLDERKQHHHHYNFFRINDEVMGGKSTSTLEATSFGSLLFTGLINTNGGGFASCRTLGDEKPLGMSADSSALEIEASGDGQLHKVVLHLGDSWAMSTPIFAHDFAPTAGFATYRLPLSDFIPSRQGRAVNREKHKLDASSVTGLGFSLSLYTADGRPNPQFGDGPFRLEVRSVREV